MASIKPAYAAAAAITCTLASLASGSARRSAVIDNSTNLFDDALVHVTVTCGTVTSPGVISVYAYASGDDGTTYETGGSTDAAYTLRGDEKLLGTIAGVSATAVSGVFSVARAFGGVMPRNWGIIIAQTNCGTLNATEGNHIKKYQGVQYTVA